MKLQRTYESDPIWLLLAPTAAVALLLMFLPLLCTSFLLQPGIAVKSPRSPFLLPPQNNPLVISITGPPLPAFFFDNHRASFAELETWLNQQKSRYHSVIIKADQYAPAGLVTNVLNRSLRHNYSVILATEEGPHVLKEKLRPRD